MVSSSSIFPCAAVPLRFSTLLQGGLLICAAALLSAPLLQASSTQRPGTPPAAGSKQAKETPQVCSVEMAALPTLANPRTTGDVPHGGQPTANPPYRLPFGADPYAPSEARAQFTGFLKQSDVPSAKWCGHCHQGIYAQWRQSAHANSFRTPWYIKNVNLLIDSKGIERSRHCEGCHNPIALFAGMLTSGAPRDAAARPFDDEGVTCMACHAIRSLQPVRGLGSYVMGIPTALLDEHGNPIPGMPPDAEIYAHIDRHRAAVMRDLYTTPEFCGACHKANLPKTLNDYKWLRAFDTYDEWQQSGWARSNPLSFFPKGAVVPCQSCHMREEAADDPGGSGHVHSHRWLGANTAIPVEYGYKEQLEKVIQFLRQDALRVDVFALTVEHREGTAELPGIPLIAPLDQASGKANLLHGGDVATVDVVVQNTGIGHSLVPEQRDMYQSWLAVDIRDNRGRIVYESGGLDAAGHLLPDTHSFTNCLLGLDASRNGGRLNHHEVWEAEARSYDSTVMSGRAVVERYRFRVPQAAGSLTISAAVRYRRFRRVFLDWVFADKPEHVNAFPVVTIAADSVTLPVAPAAGGTTSNNSSASSAVPAPQTQAPAKPGLAIRWTAYGIGLLDRQQNREAEEAFAHATAIQPSRAWGYVNEAVAFYTDGDWTGALAKLHRALELEPGDVRALYYEGMCLRWQHHWKDAERILTPVAAEYPRFVKVHDNLGYIFLVEREYASARREFEAALMVDPDDLTAHKWLAGAYLALGMKEQAAVQAAATSQIQDDPQAAWRVQSYWRNHPEVANEVVLNHVHGLQDAADARAREKILNTQNPPSYVWIQH